MLDGIVLQHFMHDTGVATSDEVTTSFPLDTLRDVYVGNKCAAWHAIVIVDRRVGTEVGMFCVW